jgi:WD40 repeat protein
MGTSEPTVKAEEQYDKPLAASVLGLTGDDAQWSTQLHTEPVLCVDAMVDPLDPTAWFGVSGSADASIGVFRVCVETGVFVKEQTLTIKESGLSDVKIRPDGKVFATAGWDGCIRVFGVKKLQPLAIMRYHEVGVHAIEFGNVHEGVLCSASKDGKIAWWNIFEGK